MAKKQKTCRICGKLYTPCSYCENDKMAFHYRAYCCSAACARVYLALVQEARTKQSEQTQSIENVQTAEVKAEQADVATSSETESNSTPDTYIKVDKSADQDASTQSEEKPKKKTRTKNIESESSEQIE